MSDIKAELITSQPINIEFPAKVYTPPVLSVNSKTGAVVLSKTDIGLANVDNTSDADKPISTDTQVALDLKADKTEIPTELSELNSDANNRTVTDIEKSTWNGKQDYIGYTPENQANKSSNTSLGTSDILYPTQNAVKTYVDNKCRFIQTVDSSISNTTVEKSLFSTGVGSRTIPANFLSVGSSIRVLIRGVFSSLNGESTTIRIRFGSVLLLLNTSSIPTAVTNAGSELGILLTVRSIGTSGSIICAGGTIFNKGQGFSTITTRDLFMTSPATINTTIDNTIDITYQWATASSSNSFITKVASIETLR